MNGIGIACFTDRGGRLADQIQLILSDEYEIDRYQKNLKVWTESQFQKKQDAIIFVGACGIAVRAIAPYLKSKTSDPAVLVIDEAATFVISLVSGHIGGANKLAVWLAERLNATPVITTATDVNGKFAVDVFAKENHLYINNMKAAKEISAAILKNEQISFYCDEKISGKIPAELTQISAEEAVREPKLPAAHMIWISKEKPPVDSALHLIPRNIILGIGCRKEKPMEAIETEVLRVLKEEQIHYREIESVASIDLKKEEPGLIGFCNKYGIPFITYSSEELKAVEGEFSPSQFVAKTTGVDNVCERAALKKAGNTGKLIHKKDAGNGVTVSVAVRDWSVKF